MLIYQRVSFFYFFFNLKQKPEELQNHFPIFIHCASRQVNSVHLAEVGEAETSFGENDIE